MRVIAPIAVGRSGWAPIPTAATIAEPRTAVSRTSGTRTGKPVTSALTPFQNAAPGRAAADAHGGDLDAGRQHRRRDVADGERGGLDDRPRDVTAAVPEGQAGEHAARLGVPDRRTLAGEVREEDEAVGTGRGRGGLGQERLGRDRPAEDVVAVPVERPARGGHRRPDAVAAGQWRRA